MVEPISFKTNIGESATVAKGTIADYDQFRQKVIAYTKTAFDKAPDPAPVIDYFIAGSEGKKSNVWLPCRKRIINRTPASTFRL